MENRSVDFGEGNTKLFVIARDIFGENVFGGDDVSAFQECAGSVVGLITSFFYGVLGFNSDNPRQNFFLNAGKFGGFFRKIFLAECASSFINEVLIDKPRVGFLCPKLDRQNERCDCVEDEKERSHGRL